MLRAMDSAVSGLKAHQNKMDVIGNNIANVNTFGFKAQTYSFKEAMYQTSSASTGGVAGDDTAGTGAKAGSNAAQYGFGAMMGSISTDMTSSIASQVGGFNACIDGEGFFLVSPTAATGIGTGSDAIKKAGDLRYTRVGQFNIDSQGYLVDSNNNFVYGFATDEDDPTTVDTAKLVPLRAPLDSDDKPQLMKNVQINSFGEISATVGEGDAAKTVTIGKVAIATFQNPNGLTKAGGGYYKATADDNTGLVSATEPGGSTASLMTGYLEASNVDLAKEFSEMITTQRGFQANSKIITVSDEMLSDLISMKR